MDLDRHGLSDHGHGRTCTEGQRAQECNAKYNLMLMFDFFLFTRAVRKVFALDNRMRC